jgi:hypothetical protein
MEFADCFIPTGNISVRDDPPFPSIAACLKGARGFLYLAGEVGGQGLRSLVLGHNACGDLVIF